MASSSFIVSSQSPSLFRSSSALIKWGFGGDKECSPANRRTKSRAFRVLANPNVSGEGSSKREVIMVDPVEAKRLAAKQMQEIRLKEKMKRRRQAEAINGAWAMIGLTAAFVIEGQTGQNILNQLKGYLNAIVHIFWR